MHEVKKRRSLVLDITCGLLAGAAATLVMDQVSAYAYTLEDKKTQNYEEKLRHGESSPEVLASKIATTLGGGKLNKDEKKKYGSAVHWGYGVMWGGLFGALRNRISAADSAAGGVAFGLGLWLIGDEVMVPALGLSPPTTEFPWQNHARAAANHLAYGGTLGLTHSLLRKI